MTMPMSKTVSAKQRLAGIAADFAIGGAPVDVRPYGAGHIHETYRVRSGAKGGPGFILQKVNRRIFGDVPALMANIVRVTDHMRRRLAAVPGSDPEREVLTVVPTRSGQDHLLDATGEYWRCFRFIAHRELGARPGEPRQAREAGRLYGRFLGLLADLPPPPLHETIPRFHDLGRRLSDFHAALAADRSDRRRGAAAAIAFVAEREQKMATTMARARAAGLPLRVTHNDTKFNNILFDARGRGLCVIDLDTVMPGHVLYDFGDAIRSAANAAREDDPDPRRARIDMAVFADFSAGYLGELGRGLGPVEIDHLVFAARMMTFIIGLRFLTDHLDGDRYFKIRVPGHNLERARVQFRLLADMERRRGEMEAIVSRLAAGGPA
jgi:hypothetical protein